MGVTLTKGNILKLRILSNIVKMVKEIIDDPEFYGVKEPALSRLNYIYKRLNELYDLESGVYG